MGGRSTGSSISRFRVVCFDLDGTLVPSPASVCLHLSRWLGHEEELADLEVAYAEGRIHNHEVAERDAAHYAGKTRSEIDLELASLPLVSGIPETLARMRGMNMSALIATVTWRFAAEHLADRFGFDEVTGCVMEEDCSGRFTGKVGRHIDAADKVAFVRSFCEPRGIDLADCVAVGDSRSDIPLFREVGLAIAFNGTDAAKEAAHVAVDGDSLLAILAVMQSPPGEA